MYVGLISESFIRQQLKLTIHWAHSNTLSLSGHDFLPDSLCPCQATYFTVLTIFYVATFIGDQCEARVYQRGYSRASSGAAREIPLH